MAIFSFARVPLFLLSAADAGRPSADQLQDRRFCLQRPAAPACRSSARHAPVPWPALHGLDTGHRPPRRHEALEAEHGPRSAHDAAVFLHDPSVAAWVLDLSDLVDLRLKYFSLLIRRDASIFSAPRLTPLDLIRWPCWLIGKHRYHRTTYKITSAGKRKASINATEPVL